MNRAVPTFVPILLAAVLDMLIAMLCYAQFAGFLSPAQAPQAKTEEELDAILEIYQSAQVGQRLDLTNQFLRGYPDSEFRGIALQYQMEAYQELGKLAEAIASGEAALKLHPNNVNTLIALAKTLPSRVSSENDPGLQRARDYANLALRELETMRIPRSLLPDQWETLRRGLEAEVHESLGYVAAKQGNPAAAVKELEIAVKISLKPTSSMFFRLAVAYEMAGRPQESADAYQKVRAMGPAALAEAAERALVRLGSYRTKRRGTSR